MELTPIERAALLEIKKRGVLSTGGPLWPKEYLPNAWRTNSDCAYRFLTECCWSFNEADQGSIALIPDLEYIKWFCERWCENRSNGGVLICEKSRRLIMSWVCRGLELWAMGLKPQKFVICGLNYARSAEHVWRIAFLYNQLRERRPEFNLPPCTTRGGNMAAQLIVQTILPNGSITQCLNQMGQSFQGSGYSGVTMEEFSQYKNPSYMYSQARRVTEGKPGKPGGFVVAITNAFPGDDWKQLKK